MKLGDREVEAEVESDGEGLRVNLGDGWRSLGLKRLGSTPRFALMIDGRTVDVLAKESPGRIEVLIGGVTYVVSTARPRKGRVAAAAEDEDDAHFENGVWSLRSPQTGSVVDIRVSVGASVEPGTVLMVVEAMKMQNELRSRVAGTVSSIKVERGQRVETGAVLLEVAAPTG
ncbi:MAG TPA: biotin/lipoyl-containing protein [Dehalococcoidia bacterium]|nr:biotin/lipoyl-containing protein [Dehalococcoidia bacterium]